MKIPRPMPKCKIIRVNIEIGSTTKKNLTINGCLPYK